MRKIFSIILVSLLAFPITACGRNKAGETGTAGGVETIPTTDTIGSVLDIYKEESTTKMIRATLIFS